MKNGRTGRLFVCRFEKMPYGAGLPNYVFREVWEMTMLCQTKMFVISRRASKVSRSSTSRID